MFVNNILSIIFGVPLINTNLTVATDCQLSVPDDYPTCYNWTKRRFDFIIVGAGTAGSTLAARLIENPEWDVLVIEAGGIPSNTSQVPGLFESLQKTPEDWSFQVKDPNLFRGYKNSQFSQAQGKTLGGSSTINTLAYMPGYPEDYDNWSNLGNDGWDYTNLTHYFTKALKHLKFTTYESQVPTKQDLSVAVQELGIVYNSGRGYQNAQIQTNKGERFSHAKAYLTPFKDKGNLCVVTGMLATSLWYRQSGHIQGVKVLDLNTGKLRLVKADLEVILSAGAINTPKLLMLSGIGPKDHLSEHSIRTVANLPVGQNLMDHVTIPIMISVPNDSSSEMEFQNSRNLTQLINTYCLNKTGLDTIGLSNYQGYINVDNPTNYTDPKDLPNLELLHYFFSPQDPLMNITLDRFGFLDIYQDKLRNINKNHSLLIILVNLLHPESRGSIQLNSRYSFVPPKITPGYFTHAQDMQTLFGGIAYVNRLLGTQSMSGYEIIDLGVSHCSDSKFNSNNYWKCYAKVFPMSIFHQSGTCKMGLNEKDSVVDPRLRVWGLNKLRVVDASIVPEMIRGHLNVPVGVIADKAGDIIRQDHGY